MDMMERVVIGLQNLRETIKTATQHTFTFSDIRAKNVKRIDNTLALLKEQERIIKSLESDLDDCKAVIAEQTNIVRCKDCIHWDKEHSQDCDNSDSVCFHNGWCKPDWFCADGERQ